MICSNCMEDREDVFEVLPEKKYNSCPKCSVIYAKNRIGEAFLLDEEVNVKQGYNSKLDGRPLIIKGIFIMEECESGRMIFMHDKESGKPLKMILDTNWLTKIKN